ncbi:XapX domain-containing protein [Bacillus sp. 2205SS5-2]|uniref:XapX domain-containing protein n=1 Tax=Bacillus sp. 2205SS5-2 TaxID=3109031 RepID=UPI00300478D2
MKEVLLSVLAGIIIGVVFKFMKLPLPAPPVLAGVMGIFGVYFGGVLVDWILKLINA